jgi:hypothetical protein
LGGKESSKKQNSGITLKEQKEGRIKRLVDID